MLSCDLLLVGPLLAQHAADGGAGDAVGFGDLAQALAALEVS